ncbi:hypothetical protein Acr_00g0003710 [Actinidia rufa]|uniref:CCHC-type domain-containing protein n=1 Tax=Actinidia rufa TaxID=165716 RepID=A0A7J0D7A4_9ERIC|nr:hypothetical protein Acr_00g0003710 [Actinidia rufa]
MPKIPEDLKRELDAEHYLYLNDPRRQRWLTDYTEEQRILIRAASSAQTVKESLRQVKASVNSLVNLSGDYESREVVKNSASTSKVKEDTDFSSPVGSRICAGVQIVTGIPYSSRQIGAIDSVGAQHNEEGAEDEIEPDRRISTMKTCELSSEEESVSEDTSTSSNEDYRHISMAKKYFERPPPIDLAFGDPIKAHDGFNDQSIYPWSIDGLHPEQINRMLGMMIAASNAYLHGKNEAETAYRLITEGFLGTLINWWDHLPKEAKAEIEASVRIDLSPGQPARDSEGQLIPNPVDSLLATIRTHFCGPLESDEKKHRAALMSLRIKSLDEYKWYKDVFLERVFYMPDCNRAVWKDKFLAGLPNGLGDLVRSRLKEDDLDLMTFGELFAAVDQLLIERCTQKKVENAEKKALSFGKNICWQFVEKKKFSEKHSSRRPSKGGKERRCYKCNKIGHYAKDCKAKRVGAAVQDQEDTSQTSDDGDTFKCRGNCLSSSDSSSSESSKKKEKTKVLPEHYVSQKAIDDLCRRAKTVHPTVNDFHGELKSLQQYTRSLDSRLSSLETQVRRASQRSDGGIRDTTRKKSPKKFIKSSDDSKEEFPNSEDEGDPSPSAYIGTMAQQAQKWVSQSDYNCVRADLIPIITGNDVRRKPKLLMGRSYLLHGWCHPITGKMNGVERSHAMAPISSTIRLVSSKTTIEEEDGIQKESVMLSLRQLEDVFTRLNSLKLGFAAEDQADAWPDPVVVQGRADSMPSLVLGIESTPVSQKPISSHSPLASLVGMMTRKACERRTKPSHYWALTELLAAVKGKSLFLRVAFSIVVPMAFFPESANMKARWLTVESSPSLRSQVRFVRKVKMQAAPLFFLYRPPSVAGERQTFIWSLLSPMGASPGRNLTRARLVASFAVLYTAGRRRERSPGFSDSEYLLLMPSVTNRKEFTPSGRGSGCGFESKRLPHAGRV